VYKSLLYSIQRPFLKSAVLAITKFFLLNA